MKIKKTLFSTELEVTPNEIREFWNFEPNFSWVGIIRWVKHTFGLNLAEQLRKPKVK